MTSLQLTHCYFAQTKPRQEEVALAHLERQGYPVKLPRVTLLRRPSKRETQHAEQSIAPVRSNLGITRVVRFGMGLAKIGDRLLEDRYACVDQTERSLSGLLVDPSQTVEGAGFFVRDGLFFRVLCAFGGHPPLRTGRKTRYIESRANRCWDVGVRYYLKTAAGHGRLCVFLILATRARVKFLASPIL